METKVARLGPENERSRVFVTISDDNANDGM